MRSPSRILGQECAELLGAVLKEKEFLEKLAKRTRKGSEGGKIYTVSRVSVADELCCLTDAAVVPDILARPNGVCQPLRRNARIPGATEAGFRTSPKHGAPSHTTFTATKPNKDTRQD